MKKLIFSLFTFGLCILAQAQTTPYKMHFNEVDNFRNFHVLLYPEFFIAPGDRELALPSNLVVDARYWLGTIADFRAGASFGTNLGLRLGGTLHLRDHIRSIKEKFVLGSSKSGRTETTRYLKIPVQARGMSGPCVDLFIGNQFGGFTSKVDLGWEFQGYRRAQILTESGRYINGALNGYHSMKFQAVFQTPIPSSRRFLNKEGAYIIENFNTIGVGGQVSFDASVKPWKFATLYGGLSMGYIKVAGEGSAPILSIRFGVLVANSLKL